MTNRSELNPRCPCGSDTNYRRCCGRRSKARPDPRKAEKKVLALYTDSCNALRDDREMHCLSAVKEILKLQPYHFGALTTLFRCRNHLSVFSIDDLSEIATNILEGFRDETELACSAGDVFEFRGAAERAAAVFQGILKRDAHHFRANFGMGRLSQRLHQLDLAEFHFRHAFFVRSNAHQVVRHLADVLSAMGRKYEAEHYLKIATALAPQDLETLFSWVRLEESRGNLDRAWSLFASIPQAPEIRAARSITEAVLHRRNRYYKKSIVSLDAVDLGPMPLGQRASYWFERCYTLDKLGLFDQAFGCAQNANEIKEKHLALTYDEQRLKDTARRLRAAFTKKRLHKLKPAQPLSERDETPVFICGFTRSGTSMVEQVLSAHSNICGGDELPFIYDLARNAPKLLDTEDEFPLCLFGRTAAQTQARFQMLRRRYLERLRLTGAIDPGVRKVTDKMPMNEFHLGLIHLLFPEARIVHVFRHPLDSVLSSYFTDATHGGFCTYNLVSAAKHYRLLFEMTEYYRSKLDLGYATVRYEDIVGDINKEVKKLLEFVDEPFEQGCVDFHQNPRYSRTASYAQVTQKLYDSSLFRYRNYLPHLSEIIPILKPVIDKLGYKV